MIAEPVVHRLMARLGDEADAASAELWAPHHLAVREGTLGTGTGTGCRAVRTG
ncbi:hypothetical protein [Actinacidiphila yeochonensis]|uniref:hypothetical protein n=1 Tax=Actinacidiphila yeochonensis TaxID=89050 RepID=UPI000AA9E647|nr:hypothetical protein [Actinacidiphila yeochonensis]